MRIQNQLNYHGPQVQLGRVSMVGPWNDADAPAVDSPVENDPPIFFPGRSLIRTGRSLNCP